MAARKKRYRTATTETVRLVEPKKEGPPPSCIACRFGKLSGSTAFLGGVAVARLFGDPRSSRALTRAFEDMCHRHQDELRSLKDLRLLHLSEAIVEAYGSDPYAQASRG